MFFLYVKYSIYLILEGVQAWFSSLHFLSYTTQENINLSLRFDLFPDLLSAGGILF